LARQQRASSDGLHRPRAHATPSAAPTGSLPAGHRKLAHVAVHAPETQPAPASASQSALLRHLSPAGQRPIVAPPVVLLALVMKPPAPAAPTPPSAVADTLARATVPAATRQAAPQSTPASSPSWMPLLHDPAPCEMVPTTRGRPPVRCRHRCVRQNWRRSPTPHRLRLPSSTARSLDMSAQSPAWNVHTCIVDLRIAQPRGASAKSGHPPAARSAACSSRVTLAAVALRLTSAGHPGRLYLPPCLPRAYPLGLLTRTSTMAA